MWCLSDGNSISYSECVETGEWITEERQRNWEIEKRFEISQCYARVRKRVSISGKIKLIFSITVIY